MFVYENKERQNTELCEPDFIMHSSSSSDFISLQYWFYCIYALSKNT